MTPAPVAEILERFAGARVLVLGESMLDVYVHGSTRRLCREGPVPVVDLSARTSAPGGAANVAVNAASLGAHVRLVSVVGDDEPGREILRLLDAAGVDRADVLPAARATLTKTRVLADGQLLLRLDGGDVDAIDADTERGFAWRLSSLAEDADAIIVSDYGYGFFTPALVQALQRMQRRAPRLLVVDSKDCTLFRDARPTAVKPNFEEALRMLGGSGRSAGDRVALVAEHQDRLFDATGAQVVAVTLDSDGAVALERGKAPYRTYARPTTSARTTGAGDTFVAAFALALAAGAHTPAAAEIGSAAAATVVTRDGTAVCRRDELQHSFVTPGKVMSLEPLLSLVTAYRNRGQRVVFTNGCFDILHRGHISYLNRAKTLGDVLVVAVNSDPSVARLKGPERPINRLEDRMQVLAALSCVDHIVPFEEDTAENVIAAVRPDVFVKGGDYERGALPEARLVERYGGRVEILPYEADLSTTGIIERIRANGDALPGPAAGPPEQRAG